MDNDKVLRRFYYDPTEGYKSATKLYQEVKKYYPSIKADTIKNFVDRQEGSQ